MEAITSCQQSNEQFTVSVIFCIHPLLTPHQSASRTIFSPNLPFMPSFFI
jgi:hypothetical protein